MTEEPSNRPRQVGYLIIGAGPAGLQLAYFLERAGHDYLVLDAADRAGSYFDQFPRHDKLLSINKVHTGYTDREPQLRYDWNSLLCDDPELAFTRYTSEYFPSARLLAKYFRDFAQRYALRVQYNTRVAAIDAGGPQASGAEPPETQRPNFLVTAADGARFACRVLVAATGLAKPFVPNIPGIEHAENYWDCSIDPEDFKGQRVLILGKGNSAFETANHLTAVTRVTHLCSPNPIRMAWKTHFFGHLRAVNNDFLDTYILKGQNSVLDADIQRIEQVDGEFRVDLTFAHAKGQRAQLAYDRVIACTGFRWDPAYFGGGVSPETTPCGRLPQMTSAWESTNTPHLYYAGTITQTRDLHKTMSSVLHGFRFNVKSLASILAERYESAPWPTQRLPLTAEALADKVIERVSTSAALMHQPGFLCDVLTVNAASVGEAAQPSAEYAETLAVDYAHDSRFGEQEHYYTVTMEYGDTLDDILAVRREPDPDKAYNDFYLHPRIQRFRGNEKIAEHHMSESLENEWRLDRHPGERPLIRKIDFHGQDNAAEFQQTHRDRLIAFFAAQLAASGSQRALEDAPA
ncbi:MAG: NAD(P)-binding domain-containing protein [Planctomycetota bacterium]